MFKGVGIQGRVHDSYIRWLGVVEVTGVWMLDARSGSTVELKMGAQSSDERLVQMGNRVCEESYLQMLGKPSFFRHYPLFYLFFEHDHLLLPSTLLLHGPLVGRRQYSLPRRQIVSSNT